MLDNAFGTTTINQLRISLRGLRLFHQVWINKLKNNKINKL